MVASPVDPKSLVENQAEQHEQNVPLVLQWLGVLLLVKLRRTVSLQGICCCVRARTPRPSCWKQPSASSKGRERAQQQGQVQLGSPSTRSCAPAGFRLVMLLPIALSPLLFLSESTQGLCYKDSFCLVLP